MSRGFSCTYEIEASRTLVELNVAESCQLIMTLQVENLLLIGPIARKGACSERS